MASFFDYLDYLRSKPEEMRRQAAFWSSLLLTGLILLLWFVNLRLTAPRPESSASTVPGGATEEAPFWSRVGQGFKEVPLRIKEGWRVISR